jgi:hypothetical protein
MEEQDEAIMSTLGRVNNNYAFNIRAFIGPMLNLGKVNIHLTYISRILVF